MKTVQFTNIHLEHFGKHESIKSELGHRTAIEGANATGKSTIKRAIQYILGTKDENGKEISGIRPHDENGIDIDGLTTVAELTVSVDGAENTLKRTCFQEKNRQGEYTGKDNLQYFVDDVKKGTKKAYDEFVSTIIPNPVCISAYELLSKETETRRKILEDTFSTHSNDDVIDMHPEYEELRGKLRANTPRDLKSALRKKRDGYKEGGKKAPGLIDEREKVIHQIEFEQSQKVDIDLAELELLKNSLNEQIAEKKEKQTNVDKQFEEYDRQSKDILDLQFALSDLERKANEELERQRRKIDSEKFDKENELNSVLCENKRLLSVSEEYEEKIEYNEAQRRELLKNWELAAKREFDENSLVCSYCGQEYPKEEKERLRAKFASDKADEIARIEEKGKKTKEKIDSDKKYVKRLKETVLDNEKTANELKKEVAELEKQMRELPEKADVSENEEIKEIKKQIQEKETAMKQSNSASEIRQQLQDEREDLQRQLNEVQKRFDLAKKNDEIDERVSELRQKQRELSQEIADIEKELLLLQDFEREKARLLEEDLNKNCDYIRFKMSEIQQNGELKDVCQILVNGESFDRNLNFSSQLLVCVDICRMFQKLYDVQLPILLDNAESINNFRLPDIENQLILFRCSDEPELTIECLEG